MLLSRIVLISSVNPIVMSPPPYNFGSIQLGLFTLSSLVGVVIAYPIAGPLTDILSRILRRRSGGIHQPEHRFPALIVPFIVCPPGLIAYGYTFARQGNFYGAAAGFALQSAGLVLVPSVVLSYTVDTYPRRSGEALVLINAIKNSVAFGFTKAVPSWLAHQGVKKMFVELAGIQWAVLVLAVPLYFASPWLRRKTLRFV
jgi:MFS family permease